MSFTPDVIYLRKDVGERAARHSKCLYSLSYSISSAFYFSYASKPPTKLFPSLNNMKRAYTSVHTRTIINCGLFHFCNSRIIKLPIRNKSLRSRTENNIRMHMPFVGRDYLIAAGCVRVSFINCARDVARRDLYGRDCVDKVKTFSIF